MLSPQKEFDKFIPEISKGKMPFQEFFPLQDCHRPLPWFVSRALSEKYLRCVNKKGKSNQQIKPKAMEVQSQSGDYCLPSNYGDFTGVCVGIENVHMLLHVRRLVSSVVQGWRILWFPNTCLQKSVLFLALTESMKCNCIKRLSKSLRNNMDLIRSCCSCFSHFFQFESLSQNCWFPPRMFDFFLGTAHHPWKLFCRQKTTQKFKMVKKKFKITHF